MSRTTSTWLARHPRVLRRVCALGNWHFEIVAVLCISLAMNLLASLLAKPMDTSVHSFLLVLLLGLFGAQVLRAGIYVRGEYEVYWRLAARSPEREALSFHEHLVEKASQDPLFSQAVAVALAAGLCSAGLVLWMVVSGLPALPSGVLIETLARASRFFVVGLGFMAVFATTKVFALSQAALIAAAPYFTVMLADRVNLPLVLSVIVALLLTGLLGLLSDRLVFRPLRSHRGTPLTGLVASLGLYTMLQNGLSLGFGDATLRLSTAEPIVVSWLGMNAQLSHLLSIASAALLLVVASALFRSRGAGRLVRAVAEDGELAESKGVATERVISSCFLASSVLMGLSGLLISLDLDISPTMGLSSLLMGIVAALLFRWQNPLALAAGALTLAGLLAAGDSLAGAEWRNTIAFGLLALICMRRADLVSAHKRGS